MIILFSIVYILISFFTNANMLARCLKYDFFHKYKNTTIVVFSIIFGIWMAILTNNHLMIFVSKYTLIYFFATTLIFFILIGLNYLKTKTLYEESLAKTIDLWEIITFIPIFFIYNYFSFSNIKNNPSIQSFIFSMILFLFFYKACKNATKPPKIKSITITENKLTNDLKIILVADIHLKKNLNDDFFKNIVYEINQLNADCVMIAGDLIDTSIDNVKCLHYLNDIKSKYGTFYVLGNHEYYHNVEQIASKLQTYNIHFLDNKSIEFDDFTVSGVNDLTGIRLNKFTPDMSKLQPNQSKLNILLTHQPKFVKKYNVDDYDLILAGHTHAGQIFPFSLAVKLEQGFLSGLYNINKNKMYVTSGAGFWGAIARVGTQNEIVLIDIKAQTSDIASKTL